MDQKTKKKLFISGPVSGKAYYWKAFDEAKTYYSGQGYAVMVPSDLPVGMGHADYARVCLAMVDSADEVAFLPGWEESAGARLEMEYCCYTGKVTRMYEDDTGPKEYRCDLEEGKACVHKMIVSDMPVCGSSLTSCKHCTVVPKRKFLNSSTDELYDRAKKAMKPYAKASFNPLKAAAVALDGDLLAAILTGKDRGAVKVKKETDLGDAVKIEGTIDLTALGAAAKEPEETDAPEETSYDEKCFVVLGAVEKAVANGYQIDLSLDENGWLNVGLYPQEGKK